MISTLGSEFKRYYNDPAAWPEGAWYDDAEITVDGEDATEMEPEQFPDDAKVRLRGGVVYPGT